MNSLHTELLTDSLERLVNGCRDSLVRDIQDLVRIKSVEEPREPGKPFGTGPANALACILKKCEEQGFRTTNLDNYVGFADYGEGDYTLALLTHVDTVPFGEGWTVDPLGGLLKDGKIYGRGSYDDKGPAVTSLYALSILKELGAEPKGKIRLIFGANEETGMMDMVYYLKHQPQPDLAFSPDAPFPVVFGEKGIMDLMLHCPLPSNNRLMELQGGTGEKKVPEKARAVLKLSIEEKRVLLEKEKSFQKDLSITEDENGNCILSANGKSGSSASPADGENAISILMDFLQQLDYLDISFLKFIQDYNSVFGYDTTGSSCGCGFVDSLGSALTLNVAKLTTNDAGIDILLQIRYPVQCSGEDVQNAIQGTCKRKGWQCKQLRHSPAHYYPVESSLVKNLMKIYQEETGDLEVKPVWMSGGTYARSLKNAVAFGPLFPGEPQKAHGPDEYVTVESMQKAMRIYIRAMLDLGCR